MVKVTNSLIAIGAVGVRDSLSWAQLMKGREPIPLLLLPYASLIHMRYPVTAGLTERVFQLLDGET